MADDTRCESTGVPMTHTHTHSTAQAGNGPAGSPPGHGPVSRVPGMAVDITTDGLPAWLDPVADAARSVRPQQLSRFLPPESGSGPAVRRPGPVRRGGARTRAAAHGAGRDPALPRRTAVLPRGRAGSRGRRPGHHRAVAGGAARGRGGDRARPSRRTALRRAAPALHPGQQLRRDARARLVAGAQPGRGGRSGQRRPGSSRSPWRISRIPPTGPRPCTRAGTPARHSWSNRPWSGVSRPE